MIDLNNGNGVGIAISVKGLKPFYIYYHFQ